MPKRYLARPVARRKSTADCYEADPLDSLARTVHEPDNEPQPTGLLDRRGNELFSVNEMDPVGFVRFGSSVR